jgi:single-strand DNA-binding protein
MSTVMVNGTLTRDPEMRDGAETKVCSMRIVELNGRRKSPLYINVAAFGRQAETCEEYLRKGRHVAVSGQLRLRQWEDDDGNRRSEHSIAADRVDFLPGGKKRRGGAEEHEGEEEVDDDQ